MAEPSSEVGRPLPEHPTFNAMLICDHTIREEGTGKISLIGIFANVYSTKFPVALRACVYVNLGNAEGAYALKLDLVRAHVDMQVIGSGSARAEIPDRQKPAEIIFDLPRLAFEGPGRYEFVLYATGRLVGRKSFDVVPLGEAPA